MNPRDPVINVADALLRASGYTEQPAAATAGGRPYPTAAFTVAMSRETGSGGTAVGREVGRRLNWPVYDHELLEQIANDLRVSVHLVEGVDEHPANWLEELAESFTGGPAVAQPAYFRSLLKMLLSLGARGDCVIVGRGAALLLPAETTVRVRVVASHEDRIAAVSRDLGLPHRDAARRVNATDRERIDFVKAHFRKDLADPLNYDLVLNASRFSVAECAELVIDALNRLKARPAKAMSGIAAQTAGV
jgi:cytidylate kinase